MDQRMKWVLQGTRIQLERQPLMPQPYMQLSMRLGMPWYHQSAPPLHSEQKEDSVEYEGNNLDQVVYSPPRKPTKSKSSKRKKNKNVRTTMMQDHVSSLIAIDESSKANKFLL